jgi:hypothetical protein
MKQQVKISKVKGNPNNPRIIKNDKFKKLVKSIQEFPEMLEKRPIIVDENMMVLGGNMRLKASKDAGLKEVWIDIAEGWTKEQKDEFVVKDNVNFGEWDWDILANEWESENLDNWGINLPEFWHQEETILDTDDIKKTEYLSIVVVAYEDVQDLDRITSLYQLDSIDITEDIKSNITTQRKVYVFKK